MTQDEVTLDFGRLDRIGLEEAVYAAGKTVAQLAHIVDEVVERKGRIQLTRLSAEQWTALPQRARDVIDYCADSRTGHVGSVRSSTPSPTQPARIAIVCAGTSDVGVGREAERTLTYNGVASSWIADVGVAGLWRLTSRLEVIRGHAVVIAIAGMDAALPTVLGGLVGSALIAVPTSVGYGVAAGGHTALHAVLASCAPGICVVNIDNGYGAACAALRILRQLDAAIALGASLATAQTPQGSLGNHELVKPAVRPSASAVQENP